MPSRLASATHPHTQPGRVHTPCTSEHLHGSPQRGATRLHKHMHIHHTHPHTPPASSRYTSRTMQSSEPIHAAKSAPNPAPLPTVTKAPRHPSVLLTPKAEAGPLAVHQPVQHSAGLPLGCHFEWCDIGCTKLPPGRIADGTPLSAMTAVPEARIGFCRDCLVVLQGGLIGKLELLF